MKPIIPGQRLDLLSFQNIQRIANWLKSTTPYNDCPFLGECENCEWVFSVVAWHNYSPNGFCNSTCPCNRYGTKLVTRVAEWILKHYGENKNDPH